MGEGWHVTSGPAAVYYREADKASGNYKVSATFSAGKGQYPEGYGLVIGGSDLAGANQQYTYFLVRQDGKFLIKQRKGSSTSNVTSDWTDNAAVKQPGADGKASNELAIAVNGGFHGRPLSPESVRDAWAQVMADGSWTPLPAGSGDIPRILERFEA